MKLRANIHTSASVDFQVAVIARDGTVRDRGPWRKNLILNQGLDRAAVTMWCDLFTAAIVGTGEVVIRRDGEAIAFSQTGTALTASASFFDPTDVNRVFKFDGGAEATVTAYVSPTEVTVTPSQSVASGPGTVWYTTSTALVAETKRTTTVSLSDGANNTVVTDNALRYRRTFLFSPEVAPITYREVGWSWTGTPGAGTIFGMAPLLESTRTVLPGEQMQVIIQLNTVLTPGEITPIADTSGGTFDTAGNIMIESLGSAISQVNTSGVTVSGNSLEPSQGLTFRAIQATWTQSTEIVTSALSWAVATTAAPAMALQAYTPGNYYRDLTGSFAVTAANGVIHGFGFDAGNRTTSIKFTAPQTKLNTHKLDVLFRRSWNRQLNNASAG